MAKINAIGNASGTMTTDGDITITGAVTGSFNITRKSVDASGPGFYFNKDRAGGAITTGDELGNLIFQGYDGAAYQTGAQVQIVSTGTIGAGKVPAYISFLTKPDTADPLVERMRIGSEGNVIINATTGGVTALSVTGSITATTTITATEDVRGRSLFATGDEGTGVLTQTALTNVSDVTANGAGSFTIKSKSAGSADSTGFIKVWVGTTAYWIPFFANVAP